MQFRSLAVKASRRLVTIVQSKGERLCRLLVCYKQKNGSSCFFVRFTF